MSEKPKGMRSAIFAKVKEAQEVKAANNDIRYSGKTKKIQVRVAEENYHWLEEDAKRTGSNISAVAGMLLADAIDEKRIKLKRAMEEAERLPEYKAILERSKNQI